MYRRELFQIVGAAAVAQAKTQFLSDARMAKLELLAEAILPGAKQSKVAAYVDLMLQHGSETVRKTWTRGIDALTNLDEAAANEMKPRNETDHFFVLLKRTTIDAHYLLASGGHNMSHGFAGCTHANHGD
jgi:hypothetical protein